MINKVVKLYSIGKHLIGLEFSFLSETKAKIYFKIIFHILKNYELVN
jgi:hypothetical protein